MISPFASFSLHRLRGLSNAELSQRLTLQSEDASHVVMRDQYIEQLHRLCNEYGTVDTAWLNCDATSIYFVSHTGTRIRVYETSPIEPPDVRRQTAMRPTTSSTSPSMHVVLDQSASMSTMNDGAFAGAREVIEDLQDLPEDDSPL